MRINFFGGPGSGKSTTSAMLFSEMKRRGHSIELVSEYVKSWAIAKRKVSEFDQLYLMGKQLHYEFRFISNGIENIVTDSPVLLSACYTKLYYPNLSKVADHMEEIILEYERLNPALNIFLTRGNKEYQTEGRYQSKDEAIAMDVYIRQTLDRLQLPYTSFSFFDREGIINNVETCLKHQKNTVS